MNMIEKVAKAIAKNCVICKKLGNGEPQNHAHLNDAKAAIEAMREPSEEMIDALPPHSHHSPIKIWSDVIDAALKE